MKKSKLLFVRLLLSQPSDSVFEITIHGTPPAKSRETTIEVDEGQGIWALPEEVPVAIVYNRRNYAIMITTPDDLVDYGVGFSKTENIIQDISDVTSLQILYSDQGVDLRFRISNERIEKLDLQLSRRNLMGNTGCGLCGLENADALFKPLPRVAIKTRNLAVDSIEKALGNLHKYQPLNAQTRSVHAAAWVNHIGDIELGTRRCRATQCTG